MVTCVAQQSSTQLSSVIIPTKFCFTVNESRMSSVSCRKRLLSGQNDQQMCSLEYLYEHNDVNKRKKTGNCVIRSMRRRKE